MDDLIPVRLKAGTPSLAYSDHYYAEGTTGWLLGPVGGSDEPVFLIDLDGPPGPDGAPRWTEQLMFYEHEFEEILGI